MALIICPECSKKFSEYAISCPNCGCPTDKVLSIIENQGEENNYQYSYIEYLIAMAEQGDVEYQIKLACEYFNGTTIKKDYKKSFEWFYKAAQNENAKAFYSVGICFLYGYGTDEDRGKAIYWLEKAAELNYQKAIIKLSSIEEEQKKGIKEASEQENTQDELETIENPKQEENSDCFKLDNATTTHTRTKEEVGKLHSVDVHSDTETVTIKELVMIDIETEKKKLSTMQLFHEIFGEGTLKELYKKEKNYYIDIEFGAEIHTFAYPQCINSYIFTKKTESILNHEHNMLDEAYSKEFENEQIHLDKTINIITNEIALAEAYVESTTPIFNDFSDSYDQNEFEEQRNVHNYACMDYSNLMRSKNQPYFARIDINDSQLYIGKHPIAGFVIDWRSPESVMYYKYQMYINNTHTKLSLVRDFDIRVSKLLGFSDKYNLHNSQVGINENNTTDKYLLKIMETMRENKEIHDIIQTIQNNQYNIITYAGSNIVVNGCAGSGKTMILFHRLSYMAFNKEKFIPENIYTISPSLLALDEADQLVKDLSINKVNRTTPLTFYLTAIKKICSMKGIDYSYLGNYTLETPDICNDIFSLKTVKDFIHSVKRTVFSSAGNKEYDKFFDYYENLLWEEYSIFDKNDDSSNIIDRYNSNTLVKEEYEKILMAFKGTSFENVYATANRKLKDKSNADESGVNAIKGKFLKKLCDRYSYLFGAKIVYTKEGKVMSDENKNGVSPLLNLFFDSKKQKQNISITREDMTIFEFFEKYHSITSRIIKLKNFSSGNSYALIFEVILYITKQLKEKHNLDGNYDFEMFYTFCLLIELFGAVSNDNIEIFIDEFQNFSTTELKYIKKAFPMCNLSLFGDFNQRIENKGISNIEQLYEIDNNIDTFEINENYRNAFEITEFVNNRFNMNITPIGIHGTINEKATTIENNFGSKDRVVLIVKSLDEIFEIDALNRVGTINIIDSNEDGIEYNQLNVITVSLSKGLEFEKVYVYDHNMTNSEKYVAYTRALNELNILV